MHEFLINLALFTSQVWTTWELYKDIKNNRKK